MVDRTVLYTDFVIDFIMREVTSERVYNKIDQYREILRLFPDVGHGYDPMYDAARPPFPVWYIAVPDTPFTLYYTKDGEREDIVIFYIEHQRSNPRTRFADFGFEN